MRVEGGAIHIYRGMQLLLQLRLQLRLQVTASAILTLTAQVLLPIIDIFIIAIATVTVSSTSTPLLPTHVRRVFLPSHSLFSPLSHGAFKLSSCLSYAGTGTVDQGYCVIVAFEQRGLLLFSI